MALVATSQSDGGIRDTQGQNAEFAVTNWVSDVALVCTTDDAALGNVLGTLIKVLIEKGILSGTVNS